MLSFSLVKRLLARSERQQVSLAVFGDQVLLAQTGKVTTHLDKEEISGGDAFAALSRLIERNDLHKADVSVVLGRSHYHAILIDDPGLASEDLYSALPFKLKDFISESPLDVVADGFESPLSGRFQAMAASKSLLADIDSLLQRRRCKLKLVTVEDLQLARWTDEQSTEMVVSNIISGGVQLTVLSEGKLCFQRQVRGINFQPGQRFSEQGIDELALEVQRSVDYLSSQMRHTQIRGIILDLDSECDQTLALSLSSRLTVSVRIPDFEVSLNHRERLVVSLLADVEPLINLHRVGMGQKPPWLTFEKMLAIWAVTMFLLSVVFAYQQWELTDASRSLLARAEQLKDLQTTSQDLTSKLSLRAPSEEKQRQLAQLKREMADSEQTLDAVASHDKASLEGFAGLFRDLSAAVRKDISVQEVHVAPDSLDIKGLASSPDAVPAWVTEFQTHRYLSQRAFESMTLDRKSDQLLEFSLKTQRDVNKVAGK
ncbi:PilN domain-containing protein [Veronia pacifica]|uniref:MSHA biogenesis protein MshI n=1 Tax=Veronia pacifica TaxID=1080227 RepID=A0A1C3ELN3_9GAMM|nr:PilN domain-containing protein [Veronia pacifica]ODA34153.1 hypothetical protein A8L45_07690 [Veronia pacifica]